MGNESIHMLMISDHTFVTDLDVYAYKAMGMKVYVAQNRDEVERYLEKKKIDVVILSTENPEISAIELLFEFNKNPALASIPIVVVGVESDLFTQEKYIELGADIFIEQPVPRELFIESVKELLSLETRKLPRVKHTNIGYVLFQFRKKSHRFQISDISATGLLFKAENPLPLGEKIKITLELGEEEAKELYMVARVVRVDISQHAENKSHFVGIHFMEFKKNSLVTLKSFLKENSFEIQKLKYYV